MKKFITILFFVGLYTFTQLLAQESYWTETFDDTSTVVPRSSPGPTTPTSYKLTLSGEWIFLGVYLGGSSNACGTITSTSRTLRMPKISTVQNAGIEPPCYAVTPKLTQGVGKVIFKEGRGGQQRIISVYKSTDDGQTWELIGQTDQGTVKCENIVFEVNDVKANRIKFSNESDRGDVDLEDITITKATGTDVEDVKLIPKKFELFQNYPNPFNPTTTISFTIPQKSYVRLSIINTIGEKIVTLISNEMNPGIYNVMYDASHLPSGVYFYKLETENYVGVKKMVLAK